MVQWQFVAREWPMIVGTSKVEQNGQTRMTEEV